MISSTNVLLRLGVHLLMSSSIFMLIVNFLHYDVSRLLLSHYSNGNLFIFLLKWNTKLLRMLQFNAYSVFKEIDFNLVPNYH
jgi:hypothetical protein